MVAPGCRRRIPLLRGEPNDDERPASNEPDDPSAAGGDSCGAGLGGRERCGGRGAVAEPCGGAVHEASSSVLSNAMRRCRAGGPALVGACAAKGLMRSLVRLSVRRACSCPSRSYLIVCDHLTCRYRERIPWCHLENFRARLRRAGFFRAPTARAQLDRRLDAVRVSWRFLSSFSGPFFSLGRHGGRRVEMSSIFFYWTNRQISASSIRWYRWHKSSAVGCIFSVTCGCRIRAPIVE